MSRPLLTYLADDLTGATDALEQLACAGVKAALFFEPPGVSQLAQFGDLQAIGVAGKTRALGGDELDLELKSSFAALAALGAPYLHYKVCSTFDSSAAVGSIGRALDVGREIVQPKIAAILGGNPALGRYCAFGNLFATASVAGAGEAHRLDRHPTASRHAVTPMNESDLRRLLACQTAAQVALFDLRDYAASKSSSLARVKELLSGGAEAILFDAVEHSQLARFAEVVAEVCDSPQPALLVGPSSVETALCGLWKSAGLIGEPGPWSSTDDQRLLVGSASCSPVTAAQIDWAIRGGFAEVELDAPALAGGSQPELDRASQSAAAFLAAGRNVIVHAARGPSDARIVATRSALGDGPRNRSGELLGRAIGKLIDRCLERTPTARICLAGGDTSSYAARELGIQALELARPQIPGAPLCRAFAPGRASDRVEFAFKGGQVGNEQFFGLLSSGRE